MIPKGKQILLYIYFLFLVVVSCQNKINNTKTHTVSPKVTKYIQLADYYYNSDKADSAFLYFNKAKSIADPRLDFKNIAYSLLKMAAIQQDHDDYIGSEITATEAIQYINKADNEDYRWEVYRILGINYFSIYDFDNSILYYQKAYELKTDNKRKIAMQNNIALVYRQQKKYREAIKIFKTLLNQKEIRNNPILLAKVMDNLGSCYTLVNHPQAINLLDEALGIRLKLNNDLGLGMSYLHLSKFYHEKNPDLAKKYAQSGYEKYTKAHCIDDRLNSLELIIKNSNGEELKKNALRYVDLVDSVFQMRQKSKNQFAKIKYDSKIEKDENLKLKTHKAENELQLERQKNRNIISYIIIGLSLSLILVLYFYLTSRGNREKIEATYKSETTIAKKLHDELANDIYHTMAFAENRNLSITENRQQLLNNLEVIYSRTRDISQENCLIITDQNYVSSLKEMISEFNTLNVNLLLNGLDSVSWFEVERNKKITVYRVLQELLVNMKKHSKATLVGINFKQSDKNIIIHYTDNGKGIDSSKMTFRNGLHNVENRILNIKGEINFISAPEQGFKVMIQFPL